MNLVDRILFQCKLNPPAIALGALGSDFNVVSYGRLERSIHNVSRQALSLGLARGNLVALYVRDPVLHVVIILALMRLGIVTLSGRSPQLPKELAVDALITDLDFPYQAKRVITADAGWMLGEDTPLAPERVPHVDADDVCRIVLTSGTTGEAKAMEFTHRRFAAQMARHQYVFGNVLPNCMRTYCDIGLAAAIGFRFMIYTLARGGAFFLPAGDLESIIAEFDFYQVQNIVTSQGPLAKLVEAYERRSSVRSTSLQMIKSGGSVLPRSLSERVRARICANLINALGATETSTVASASAQAIAHIPGAAGYVLPDTTVEIVDASGNNLPTGKEGVVRIASPYNVDRYIGDPATSAEVFRNGWFYPGDTGYLTPDKLLIITGRERALLNIGGEKLQPELVEGVLLSFGGVEQAAVFAMKNEFGNDVLWAGVVSKSEIDIPALRAHCDAKLPPEFVPVAVIKVPDLPHNPGGKVDRARLAEIARATASNASSPSIQVSYR